MSSIPTTIPEYSQLCKYAVSKDPFTITVVDPDFRTYELCKIAISKSGELISAVPVNLLEYREIAEIAVKKSPSAILKIDPNFPDYYELCKIAVSNSAYILPKLAKKYQADPVLIKLSTSAPTMY